MLPPQTVILDTEEQLRMFKGKLLLGAKPEPVDARWLQPVGQ